MNMSSKVLSGLLWRFAERFGAQIITFLVQIILARLLSPSDYGLVALVTVFTNIMQVFIDSGLGNALIQKKDADELDFSTVFYFNIITCILLYGVMWFSAPLIASFYNNKLTPIVRVISLSLIVSGVKNVQQAYVSRNMLFKRFFFATVGGTICSAVFGIILAYRGMGAWAIVGQQLSNMIIDTVILWITVRWRPTKKFSIIRFKTLFSFGWKLLCSSLLDALYRNVRSLVIGKRYSSADLGYYNNGQKIPQLAVTNINASIGSVLLPALAREQDSPQQVKAHTRRAIRVSSYIMWPIMLGLAACSESLIKLILTEKWMPAVPYLRIACFTFGLYPIHTTNLQALTAMGRSDLFLGLEIVKDILAFVILIVAMPFGVMAIALTEIISSLFSAIINAWPNRKLLDYSITEQIRDVIPSFLLAASMSIFTYIVGFIPASTFLRLIVQILAGALFYYLGSRILKFESYYYIIDTINKLRTRK